MVQKEKNKGGRIVKINKKKFIIRILELLIIIATIILTPIAIKYATAVRGYEAVGGEYFIPLLGLVIIMIIETIYEESKQQKWILEFMWKVYLSYIDTTIC